MVVAIVQTVGDVVYLCGYEEEDSKAKFIEKGIIKNVAGRMLHMKVIVYDYVSLAITESLEDDYFFNWTYHWRRPSSNYNWQSEGPLYSLAKWMCKVVGRYVNVEWICRPMLIFKHLFIWNLVFNIVSSDLWNIHNILLDKYDLVFEHHNHICMTAFHRWLYYRLQCIS